MQRLESDLQCPLSLDFLDDPVTVPCCGRSFSREQLRSHLRVSALCPLCRADIPTAFPAFNVATEKKNVALASLVELYKARVGESGGTPRPVAAPAPPDLGEVAPGAAAVLATGDSEPDRPEITAFLTQVVSPSGEVLPVGHLRLNVSWDSFVPDKSLLLFAIDVSGSMAGRAMEQAKASLLHLFHATYKNRDVFSAIIPYNHEAVREGSQGL